MRTCPSLARAVLAIALGIQAANGAVVTVYQVSPPGIGLPLGDPSWTTWVSAIGPGASGMTQYVQEEVGILLVDHFPDTTITYISTPTTISYTFEENASVLYASNPPAIQTGTFGEIDVAGNVQNCTLDVGKQTGTCVEEFLQPQLVSVGGSGSSEVFSTRTQTETTTFTGALVPIATITTSGASVSRQGVGLVVLAGVVGVLGLFAIL
ncbi:hypothetical protein GALMADRAFT_243326 [Galerina marginata CBS 339.88]|uniref:Uncharacterized protein n=1 Tax=Galerina marginata (strain CBS 339.88) TaxID=685588 RepID=A0A067TK32_GALM3|nr:hypothetical protein GALMADRAFT_243326 [Galerina marginata CBS 339.88]